MRVLALDTALDACSACLFDDDWAEVVAVEQDVMARGHAEALVPMVERIAAAAGGFEGVGAVAVTVGPGSFTGLRVALAAGRAFALALEVPCLGVTTLAALAAPSIAIGDGHAVAAAIDARHDQLYVQLFDPRGRTVVEPACVPLAEAALLLDRQPGALKLVGSGANALAARARTEGRAVAVAEGTVPDIAWVARLALAADPKQALPRPFYLKPADATPKPGALARLAPA